MKDEERDEMMREGTVCKRQNRRSNSKRNKLVTAAERTIARVNRWIDLWFINVSMYQTRSIDVLIYQSMDKSIWVSVFSEIQ